jgi:hypothetical protein
MADGFRSRPSLAFWLTGGAALVWNLFGMIIYVGQVSATPEGLAAAGYTPEQIAFLEQTPVWVTSAFAISVTAGVLGSLLLLLQKAWAVPAFVVSLVAVLAQNFYSFVLGEVTAVFGTTPVMVQSAVIVIAAALIWYSRKAKDKGWLG